MLLRVAEIKFSLVGLHKPFKWSDSSGPHGPVGIGRYWVLIRGWKFLPAHFFFFAVTQEASLIH